MNQDQIADLVEQFEHDYQNRAGPFDHTDFPENRLYTAVMDDWNVEVLTYFTMLDYNRSADQLVTNILTLFDRDTRFFDPTVVTELQEQALAAEMTSIGFRYPNRDAGIWMDNSRTFTAIDGIRSLYDRADYSAPGLVEELRELDVSFLQGDKLAPFYARIVDQYVIPLDDMHELPIPVDTHIRRLSKLLFGDVSDNEIRDRWRSVADEIGQTSVSIDRYLWLIGYNWDEGGETYWQHTVKQHC